MLDQLVPAIPGISAQQADSASVAANSVRTVARICLTVMQRTLMAFGLVALGAVAAFFFKPEIADHLKALPPFAASQTATPVVDTTMSLLPVSSASAAATPAAVAIPAAGVNEAPEMTEALRQRERVTNWISRRYRVASHATGMLVSAVYETANELKLDPLLVLSVMAIESRFNPFAESPVGAQGLMQVMSKVHSEKFEDHGGVKAALNPVANIKVGSRILKDYVRRGGSVEAGLKLYVGAGALDTDFGYGAKVLGEYDRLKAVAKGKKVSIYATTARTTTPKTETRPTAESTAANDQVEATVGSEKVAAL
jgi:soluble lytic murein transglycosylase-like protein